MKQTVRTAILSAGLLFATVSFADTENGKELFNEAKCMECHNSEDFDNSKKVKNYHTLVGRVDACQRNNDAGWFDEDTEDVAEYLNKTHYKFKK